MQIFVKIWKHTKSLYILSFYNTLLNSRYLYSDHKGWALSEMYDDMIFVWLGFGRVQTFPVIYSIPWSTYTIVPNTNCNMNNAEAIPLRFNSYLYFQKFNKKQLHDSTY